MKASQRRIFVFSLTGFLLSSCFDASNQATSKLDHTFSEISRDDGVLPDIFERSRCEKVSYDDTDGSDPILRNIQSNAQNYLEELSLGIMNKVNKSLESEGKKGVFTEDLSPENFCFEIDDSLSELMNASMRGQSLKLTVAPSVFARLSSESAIASVICHELAHATMRHADQAVRPDLADEFFASDIEKKQFESAVSIGLSFEPIVLDESVISKLLGDYSEASSELFQIKYEMQDFVRSRIDSILYGMVTPGAQNTQALYLAYRYKNYVDVFSKAFEKIPQIEDKKSLLSPDERESLRIFQENLKTLKEEKIGTNPLTGDQWTQWAGISYLHKLAAKLDLAYGTGELSFVNWMESEADQVGIEICARAGLDITKFDEFHTLSDDFGSSLLLGEQGNLDSCIEAISSGEFPVRTSNTHPSPCWRIFDTKYREPQIHADDYQNLLDNRTDKSSTILGEQRLQKLKQVFEDNGISY